MTQRFVILEHDRPFLHWDFLLENGDTLDAWRLLRRPVTGEWLPAETLPAHRLMYLDYEGPVSDDRGHVLRVHAGRYSRTTWSNDKGTINLQANAFAKSADYRISDGQPEWRFQ